MGKKASPARKSSESAAAKRRREQKDRRGNQNKVSRTSERHCSGKLARVDLETQESADGKRLKRLCTEALETGEVQRFSAKFMNDQLAKITRTPADELVAVADDSEPVSDKLAAAVLDAVRTSNNHRDPNPLIDMLQHGSRLSVSDVAGILRNVREAKHLRRKSTDLIIFNVLQHIAAQGKAKYTPVTNAIQGTLDRNILEQWTRLAKKGYGWFEWLETHEQLAGLTMDPTDVSSVLASRMATSRVWLSRCRGFLPI